MSDHKFHVVYIDSYGTTPVAMYVTRERALTILENDYPHFTKVSMHDRVYTDGTKVSIIRAVNPPLTG